MSFVATFGHSGYTFVEATATQTLKDWLGSHSRALEYFGGVPAAVVPDNLKSGGTRAHRYDPDRREAVSIPVTKILPPTMALRCYQRGRQNLAIRLRWKGRR